MLSAGLFAAGCGLVPSPSPSLPPVPSATTQPTPPSGDTPQAEQCAQLMTDVQGIAVDVARVAELVGTDLFGAFALLGGITERIGDLQTRVTDPALLERIGEIQAGWDALVADAGESIQAGDTAAFERIGASLTELTDQVTSLQEFCAGTA